MCTLLSAFSSYFIPYHPFSGSCIISSRMSTPPRFATWTCGATLAASGSPFQKLLGLVSAARSWTANFPTWSGSIKVDLPSNFGTWLELVKEARNAGHLLHFNAMSFWVAEGTFAPLHGVPAVSERIQHYATLFLQLGVLFSIQERLPLWGARSPFARRWPPNQK